MTPKAKNPSTQVASTDSFIILGVEVVGHYLQDGRAVIQASCLEKILVNAASPNLASMVNLEELQRFTDWHKTVTPHS